MDQPRAFFVYGTLNREQLRGGMWPRQPVCVSPGVVSARLFDLGPYPAALKGNAWLLGEIWQFQEVDLSETMSVLDRIEGFQPGSNSNEYVRESVDSYQILSKSRDERIACWMYFSPDHNLLVGKREIIPFCNLSEIFPEIGQDWREEKVAFWPDPFARVPRSFSEE